MAIDSIDHYTILASDVDASRDFYVRVLGLTDGDRPPFDFPGAWLYLGDAPVVHLIGGRSKGATDTGSIDHVAFQASGLAEMRQRLEETGVEFREREVPRLRMAQLFVKDPDGVTVEINFPLNKK